MPCRFTPTGKPFAWRVRMHQGQRQSFEHLRRRRTEHLCPKQHTERVNIVPIKTDRLIFSFSFGSRLLFTRSGINGATLLSRLARPILKRKVSFSSRV